MGASGAAFGLDLSTMLTPESQHSGSSGAAAAAGPSRNMAAQNLTHANSVLPNAGTIPPPPAVPAGMDAFDGSMSAGFGQPQSQSQQQKQKQTLPNLTNSASANVNAKHPKRYNKSRPEHGPDGSQPHRHKTTTIVGNQAARK